MKFLVLWSGLCCYTEGLGEKCLEILAMIKLLYNPRVNKVFTHFHSLSHSPALLLFSLLQSPPPHCPSFPTLVSSSPLPSSRTPLFSSPIPLISPPLPSYSYSSLFFSFPLPRISPPLRFLLLSLLLPSPPLLLLFSLLSPLHIFSFLIFPLFLSPPLLFTAFFSNLK